MNHFFHISKYLKFKPKKKKYFKKRREKTVTKKRKMNRTFNDAYFCVFKWNGRRKQKKLNNCN